MVILIIVVFVSTLIFLDYSRVAVHESQFEIILGIDKIDGWTATVSLLYLNLQSGFYHKSHSLNHTHRHVLCQSAFKHSRTHSD